MKRLAVPQIPVKDHQLILLIKTHNNKNNSNNNRENQRKWKERQTLWPYKKTYKAMEHEGDGDTNLIGALGTIPNGLVREMENLGIWERAETIQTAEW